MTECGASPQRSNVAPAKDRHPSEVTSPQRSNVTPAKAGVWVQILQQWIPAYAGMTECGASPQRSNVAPAKDRHPSEVTSPQQKNVTPAKAGAGIYPFKPTLFTKSPSIRLFSESPVILRISRHPQNLPSFSRMRESITKTRSKPAPPTPSSQTSPTAQPHCETPSVQHCQSQHPTAP
jgi:hypothetical protein